MFVLAVAVLVEDSLDGLGCRTSLRGGDEVRQQCPDAAVSAHAAPDVDGETVRAVAALGDETQVAHRGRGAVLTAAGKGELVLPRQLEGQWVGQQKLSQGYDVGSHIEVFQTADTGMRARGNVSDGVASAALGGEAGVSQGLDGRADSIQACLLVPQAVDRI